MDGVRHGVPDRGDPRVPSSVAEVQDAAGGKQDRVDARHVDVRQPRPLSDHGWRAGGVQVLAAALRHPLHLRDEAALELAARGAGLAPALRPCPGVLGRMGISQDKAFDAMQAGLGLRRVAGAHPRRRAQRHGGRRTVVPGMAERRPGNGCERHGERQEEGSSNGGHPGPGTRGHRRRSPVCSFWRYSSRVQSGPSVRIVCGCIPPGESRAPPTARLSLSLRGVPRRRPLCGIAVSPHPRQRPGEGRT